jgi:EAL domain-containing protein (putative c-di-GMP-specific phosphodiesterase class I)
VLKIDKRFVDDIPLDRDGMEIVTAIIAMGHALRLSVVAEGVEKQDQLAYLKTQGCDQFQGYLTSQPVPAAAFEALWRQHPTDQV